MFDRSIFHFNDISSLNDKKSRYKHYNKQITISGNEQEESKLNSNINANSGARTLTSDKIIKRSFNKNKVATIRCKQNSNKDVITRACQISAMLPM